jgi:ADP-ribosylglycohydrolase
VETWTSDRIKAEYGRLTEIVSPSKHKWFTGQPAGTWSDDAQLTVAVAKGISKAGKLDMDSQKEVHIEAFHESTDGWGGSTKHSVRRLCNGVHWSKSGQAGSDAGKGTGAGNGVPMKISPVGAYVALQNGGDEGYGEAVDFTVLLSMMTHQTNVSAASALAQMTAIEYCLKATPETFDPLSFARCVRGGASLAELQIPETGPDNVTDRLKLLKDYEQWDYEKIIAEWKGGCYCYESVPFTYMFFLKDWKSIESLYNVVNAGGDTDSNGSMLAANLGALHGTSIFPSHLTELDSAQKKIVLDVAEEFWNKFGVK